LGEQNDSEAKGGSDDRASIFGVAKTRLPAYLGTFSLASVSMLVYSIWHGWDGIENIVGLYSGLLSRYIPTVVAMLITVEGIYMGGTALLLRLQRRKAREEGVQEGRKEGRQEGIEKAIQILEQSGKSDAVQILRDSNGWSP